MAPRQLALLVVLCAAPAVGLNMLDGVKKLLLKRDSAFLYQEKALFMPGANARTEAAAKTACTSGDRAAILRAVDDLEAVCVADDFLDNEAKRLDGRWRLLATVAGRKPGERSAAEANAPHRYAANTARGFKGVRGFVV